MSIDQALAQLEFNDKKGAKVIKEVHTESLNTSCHFVFSHVFQQYPETLH